MVERAQTNAAIQGSPGVANGPPQSDAEKGASPWVGVAWGVLLTLTVVIPWGMYGDKPFWSWQIFYRVYPRTTWAMLGVAWIAGLVSLAAGIWLRGRRLALAYLLAGGAALTLYLVATHGNLSPWLTFVPVTPPQDWLRAVAIVALALFLIVTGIRTRGGSGIFLSLLQSLASALVAVLLWMGIYSGLHMLKGLNAPGGLSDWPATILSLATAGLMSLGSVLAFLDSLAAGRSGSRKALAGRRLVLACLFVLFVWGAIRPVVEGQQLIGVLGPLNNEILLAGVSLIAMEGLIGVLNRLAIMRAWPASSARAVAWGPGAVAAAVVLAGCIVLASSVTEQRAAAVSEGASARSPRTGDWPQWCGRPDHNMVSDEKGLPDHFDAVTNEKTSGLANVKWVVPLGGPYTLGSPVISGGKVFIGGQDNGDPDVGVLWCFNENDGKLLWRMRSPYIRRLYNASAHGLTSTPTVEGNRVYLLGMLGDVLCLSTNGMADGNHGPFTDEAHYFADGRKCVKSEIAADGSRILECTPGTPATLGPLDADIIWVFDMLREVNCWPYNAANAAILVRGDRLYVPTTSVLSGYSDGSARLIDPWKKKYDKARYDSPSLIVLDKNTGKLLARTTEDIFDQTFHGAHSSPTLGKVNGKELLIYGGGNGTCYAFDPDFSPRADGKPAELKLVWKFDCLSPATYGLAFKVGVLAKAETIATPVLYRNRVYTSIGNDLTDSGSLARPGRLVCIDATKTGDITDSGKIWSFDDMRSTSSTVAISDGLLYTADAGGMVYCLDADSGRLYWKHATAPVWGSPLVADGKVYVGTHDGGLLVFACGKEEKLLSEAGGHADIVASPAVANGVLYVATQKYLYALQQGKSGGLVEHDN